MERIARFTEVSIKLSCIPFILSLPPPVAGRALASLLESLGCVYVKLGQLLTYQPIDDDIRKELKRLMYNVRPFPEEEAERIVRESTGERLRLKRIATASISQIHLDEKGRAVKVMKPGIREEIRRDLEILKLMELPHSFYRATVELLETSLAQETDFRSEVRNMEDMSFLKAKIPEVFSFSQDVIIMEFAEGVHAFEASLLSSDARKKAFANITLCILESVRNGIMHGDPSPGNVILTPRGDVWLIDFGVVWRAGKREKKVINELCDSILFQDWNSVESIINSEIVRGGDLEFTPPESFIQALFGERSFVEELLDEGIKRNLRVKNTYLIFIKSMLQWLRVARDVLGATPDEEFLLKVMGEIIGEILPN